VLSLPRAKEQRRREQWPWYSARQRFTFVQGDDVTGGVPFPPLNVALPPIC